MAILDTVSADGSINRSKVYDKEPVNYIEAWHVIRNCVTDGFMSVFFRSLQSCLGCDFKRLIKDRPGQSCAKTVKTVKIITGRNATLPTIQFPERLLNMVCIFVY
jgi:hypothetical protein